MSAPFLCRLPVKNRHDRTVCRSLLDRFAAARGLSDWLMVRISRVSVQLTFVVIFTSLCREIAFDRSQEFTGCGKMSMQLQKKLQPTNSNENDLQLTCLPQY
jgi:hypothetical protein